MYGYRKEILIPVIILAAGLLLLATAYSELNQVIQQIKTEGSVYLSPAEIVDLSGLEPGTRPGDTGLQRARHRLESHPAVSSAEFRWEKAGVLVVILKEAECAAVIKTEDQLYDADSSLRILSAGSARCTNVPLITGMFRRDGKVFTDVRLKEIFSHWDTFKHQYPGLFSRVSEIRVGNDGKMNVYLSKPKFRIEMNLSLNAEDLYRLQNTLSYLEKEGLKSGIADLRGKDAVIIPDVNES